MGCANITNILTQESGRFQDEIWRRVLPTSPWVGLVKRGVFPKGMGNTISSLTYERSAPLEAVPAWTQISVANDSVVPGGTCTPTAAKVPVASTQRSYSLFRRVLEGPDFCASDLVFPFQLRAQLEQITKILTEYTREEWEIRYRHDYVLSLINNKTIVNLALTSGASTPGTLFDGIDANCATAILTQGVLNRKKAVLLRNGAIESALGKENNGPILTLVTDYETSERIIYSDQDIRQDIRFGKPNELLAPYGVERSYRGFYHLLDPFPMRFTCAGGVYTEVPAFASQAATKGNKSVVNDAWLTATDTSSIIFDPMVFDSLIPEPSITNPAPGYVFDPVTFLGQWQVKNILNRDCNPDGTILYHRGTLAESPRQVHPERGWGFVHQRCDPSANLVTSCGS